MKKFTYTIQDELGLHARPAGVLAKESKKFQSAITLTNTNTGKNADAKRIMGIMGLCAVHGTSIELTFEGEDEDAAFLHISSCLKENL